MLCTTQTTDCTTNNYTKLQTKLRAYATLLQHNRENQKDDLSEDDM